MGAQGRIQNLCVTKWPLISQVGLIRYAIREFVIVVFHKTF